MAFSASCWWFYDADATSGGADHGGGFDPTLASISMAADLVCAGDGGKEANGTTPEVSSGSYNFAAGDVNHWLFIAAGTGWTPGWYRIASVAANKATLDAAIGKVTKYVTGASGDLNTVAGCATSASRTDPNFGTWTIDYSHPAAAVAPLTAADLSAAGAGSIFTSATIAFGPNHVGNILNVTAGTNCTVQRVGIVSVGSGIPTFDKAVTTGATSNGAGVLGCALDTPTTALVGLALAGNKIWFKKGTYTTLGAAITAGTNGTALLPVSIIGYYQVPGDNPTIASTNQPTIPTAYNWATANFWHVYYCSFSISTTSTTFGLTLPASGLVYRCKFTQTSTGSSLSIGGRAIACEASGGNVGISQAAAAGVILNCYCHDCTSGIGAYALVIGSVVESCSNGLNFSSNSATAIGNTVVNCVKAVSATSATTCTLINNIFAFCGTGEIWTTPNTDNNLFVNNNIYGSGAGGATSGITLTGTYKPIGGTVVDPTFTSTISTGTDGATNGAPGTTFTSAGATFATGTAVTTADLLVAWSGTGVTVGVYVISSVDSDTQLTLATSPGASKTGIYYGIVRGVGNFSLQAGSGCIGAGYGIELGVG